MEENKKFKLVTSKKTRYLLPNILTLGGVCLGISSIKFSIDGNYSLAVIFILFAAITIFLSPLNETFKFFICNNLGSIIYLIRPYISSNLSISSSPK